jgi:predicted nucleotidyltransferase
MDDVEAILSRAGIQFAYLFGSRAAGTARPESDADVAIMPGRELGLLERERLARELVEALGVPDVDLVLLDRVRLELRGRVVQEGRPIYSADEPARVEFHVRTLSEYLDFLPTLRELQTSYLAHVAAKGL